MKKHLSHPINPSSTLPFHWVLQLYVRVYNMSVLCQLGNSVSGDLGNVVKLDCEQVLMHSQHLGIFILIACNCEFPRRSGPWLPWDSAYMAAMSVGELSPGQYFRRWEARSGRRRGIYAQVSVPPAEDAYSQIFTDFQKSQSNISQHFYLFQGKEGPPGPQGPPGIPGIPVSDIFKNLVSLHKKLQTKVYHTIVSDLVLVSFECYRSSNEEKQR